MTGERLQYFYRKCGNSITDVLEFFGWMGEFLLLKFILHIKCMWYTLKMEKKGGC